MSDEVREMIRSALADEPALGLEFDQVVEDGRRRRARRRFGALTVAAVGVVAVVSVVVGVTSAPTSPPVAGALTTTAAPTSSAAASPSNRRAAELDQVLAGALPSGFEVERALPSDEGVLRFRVRDGGYHAVVNVVDAAGRGSVSVAVDAPRDGEPTCRDRPECRVVDLAGGRKAIVETTTRGGLIRHYLYAEAADGGRLTIETSNAADAGSETPTRPTPPLTEADLVRIAELSGLHW